MIVDGEPALAVNVPERLVVIPTPASIPVKFEPSPTNDVAVTIPVATTFPLTPIETPDPTCILSAL